MSYKDVLLTSTDYIKTYTNISDNIDDSYMLPAILVAQRQFLEECLGTALVRKLQQLVDDDEIEMEANEHYYTLLTDYVQDYLSFQSLVELAKIISFKFSNFGVCRTDDEKTYNVTFNEVFRLADEYQKKADYFMYRMQRFLIANYMDYPELLTYKSIEDLRQNLYSAASCSVWLGGVRGKSIYNNTTLKDMYNFPSKNEKK